MRAELLLLAFVALSAFKPRGVTIDDAISPGDATILVLGLLAIYFLVMWFFVIPRYKK